MTDASITLLLRRCQDNDSRAQTEVYKLYSRAMYNVALRVVKDAHYAEDVMQEAFLKAFAKLGDYRGEVAFGAWLKRIVINQSIDFYKRQMKMRTDEFDAAKHAGDPDWSDASAGDFTQMRFAQVQQAMHQLKPAYQMILNLHFIEGYDYEEITEILSISATNCRTTISRAKESLRKKLIES